MNLKETALAALAALPRSERDRGIELAGQLEEGSLTLRIELDGQLFSVVWDFDAFGSRLACTCGVHHCAHQAALLAALAGRGELDGVPGVSGEISARPEAPEAQPSTEPPLGEEVAEALNDLVRITCQRGITSASVERDGALERVEKIAEALDSPDLDLDLAKLRRALAAGEERPDRALTTLARLVAQVRLLRSSPPSSTSASAELVPGAERREEVRLLEIARQTQRQPSGDRLDTSYFLDLDTRSLYRELGSAQPKRRDQATSEGLFPKRLLGNLVALEPSPEPRRIRLLQYATQGLVGQADLERLLESCETEVESLYAGFRLAEAEAEVTAERLVLFAPTQTLPSSTGLVFADEAGALLPLARHHAPALCQAVDQLGSRGAVLALVGALKLAGDTLALKPLTVLIELDGRRTLRQLA